MDAARVRVLRQSCAPKSFPCPHCGTPGRRKDTHSRAVRDIAFGQIVVIELTVGEYRAACASCKTFRSHVEGIEPRAEYTNRVRDAVIDRLLDDCMSLHRVQQAMRRDFFLDLSDGFLSDCLDWKVRQADMPGYRQWTLKHFSGTLYIDELHLGHRTLLLATDPLGDFPVAFALVRANDQDHMRRFLNNLRNHGFWPRVVVTDGSKLIFPAESGQHVSGCLGRASVRTPPGTHTPASSADGRGCKTLRRTQRSRPVPRLVWRRSRRGPTPA
ncbi:transposase [Limnoglobus roseus]|uniref:Transposase n=1 Tax=Limnoglobus roseus TaxID=2598579 RepID=A0A5C1ABV4_9BACT|nr:transposase [Limnoglobus roseus]